MVWQQIVNLPDVKSLYWFESSLGSHIFGSSKMKIVCIADTHGRHKKLKKMLRGKMPEGDVIVCAGDNTPSGEVEMFMSFSNWLSRLPYKFKIVIAGNHDRNFANNDHCLCKDELLRRGIIYLEDSEVIIGGVKFYGSPWQPEFCNWAFNLPRGEDLLEKWRYIPNDTDVLITHGPPYGILDVSVYDKISVGCEDLRSEVFGRIKPKVHIFGHIHAWHGMEEHDGIKFINASSVNESYIVQNEPIVVEVEDNGYLGIQI